MLRFFRKIRQSLLGQNHVSRYLLYALGEIVLVVIGILLALQINTLNEDFKNEKKAGSYLLNLLEDLRADALRLTTLKDELEKAVWSKKYLEAIMESDLYSSDSIAYHYKNFDFINDFVPNSTTIEELKNSGDMKLISNSEVRNTTRV